MLRKIFDFLFQYCDVYIEEIKIKKSFWQNVEMLATPGWPDVFAKKLP
jgi:hypothetical protein